MKNYYELLEVNENASPEVIEKAYKVLARKYHPDVQPRDKVLWAEAEFKKISEAYCVLSDPKKRVVYDFEYASSNQNLNYERKYTTLYNEKEQLKKELHSLKDKQIQEEYKKSMSTSPENFIAFGLKSFARTIGQAAYNQTKKGKGERHRDLQALFLTTIIIAILFFIFWKVPFIRNFILP